MDKYKVFIRHYNPSTIKFTDSVVEHSGLKDNPYCSEIVMVSTNKKDCQKVAVKLRKQFMEISRYTIVVSGAYESRELFICEELKKLL